MILNHDFKSNDFKSFPTLHLDHAQGSDVFVNDNDKENLR